MRAVDPDGLDPRAALTRRGRVLVWIQIAVCAVVIATVVAWGVAASNPKKSELPGEVPQPDPPIFLPPGP